MQLNGRRAPRTKDLLQPVESFLRHSTAKRDFRPTNPAELAQFSEWRQHMRQNLLPLGALLILPLATGCAGTATKQGNNPAAEVAAKPAAPKAAEPLRTTARPVNLTATGYAVISVQSHKSAAQQRLLAIRAAKLDAYRSLAEQVYGTRLDASTTVAEMAVTSDKFRARVDGVIYGAVLANITPINNDTYEVTLTLDGAVVNDIRLLYLEQVYKDGSAHP